MAHQRLGFFGFDATSEGTPQPLHREVLDINEALEATSEVRIAWLRAQQHPTAPAFSGGVLDAWPRRMVDGFAICNTERQMVDAYRLSQRRVGG